MQDVPEPVNITTFYSGKDSIEDRQPVDEGTPRFRDIRISNVTARGAKLAGSITGLREMPIEQITLSNVRISAGQGFLIRNAKDIRFHEVHIDTEKGPAVHGGDIDDLEMSGFRSASPHGATPLIDLGNIRDLLVRGAWAPRGTGVFLRLRGAASAGIVLRENEIGRAEKAVTFADGAQESAVRPAR